MKSNVRQFCARRSNCVISPCCNETIGHHVPSSSNTFPSFFSHPNTQTFVIFSQKLSLYFISYLRRVAEVQSFIIFPGGTQQGAGQSEYFKELRVPEINRDLSMFRRRSVCICIWYLIYLTRQLRQQLYTDHTVLDGTLWIVSISLLSLYFDFHLGTEMLALAQKAHLKKFRYVADHVPKYILVLVRIVPAQFCYPRKKSDQRLYHKVR